MPTKQKISKKVWEIGDVLQKGKLKIIVHKIEENNIVYLSFWAVLHSRGCFPDDIKLQKGWKKIDQVVPYSITNVKKSKHYNNREGIL